MNTTIDAVLRRASPQATKGGLHVVLAACFVAMASKAAGLPVWINELHYDNASTDSGEFVEVAGVAGTDLAGWSIVLYNGNGGAPYGTINLSGLIPNQQNGFGTLSFFYTGIQNGSPDGLALVDSSNTVLQLLSYEGSFFANGGPANGLSTTDIGVSEDNSTPVGFSLQLVGVGSDYSDFSWSGPSGATPGKVNSGQMFRASVPDAGSTLPLLALGILALATVRAQRHRAV
jgi:hypothetical protein